MVAGGELAACGGAPGIQAGQLAQAEKCYPGKGAAA